MCLILSMLCARGAVPPARLAHVSYAPRPSPFARREIVASVSTCPRVHSRRMLVPVRGFRVVLADGHIGLAMLPAMYEGYVLALCLISNFSPFTNQALSIAGNNPPNGEQIEYGAELCLRAVPSCSTEECTFVVRVIRECRTYLRVNVGCLRG